MPDQNDLRCCRTSLSPCNWTWKRANQRSSILLDGGCVSEGGQVLSRPRCEETSGAGNDPRSSPSSVVITCARCARNRTVIEHVTRRVHQVSEREKQASKRCVRCQRQRIKVDCRDILPDTSPNSSSRADRSRALSAEPHMQAVRCHDCYIFMLWKRVMRVCDGSQAKFPTSEKPILAFRFSCVTNKFADPRVLYMILPSYVMVPSPCAEARESSYGCENNIPRTRGVVGNIDVAYHTRIRSPVSHFK